MNTTANTTCEIYAREIDAMVAQGNQASIAEMIRTWYTRCDFKKSFDGCEILDVGVRDSGVVWIKTSRGTLEFCQQRERWRLIEPGTDPIYMMARIAEVTQVPFAYLCGVRDAIAITEANKSKAISDRITQLTRDSHSLAQKIRRQRIALDAVAVQVTGSWLEGQVSSARYPDAPRAALTWSQVREHYRSTPGVYFAWNGGRIVYVGATERGMHSRLQKGHHAVTKQDMFSFVEVPINEVYFAETCYVARYAPERNACVAQANGARQGGQRGKRKDVRQSKVITAV